MKYWIRVMQRVPGKITRAGFTHALSQKRRGGGIEPAISRISQVSQPFEGGLAHSPYPHTNLTSLGAYVR